MKNKLKIISLISAVCMIVMSCGNQNKDSIVVESNEIQQMDIQSELDDIEILRQQFQLAIREKRYQDLGALVTTDMRFVGPASNDWKEFYRLSEHPMGYDSIIMSPKETVIMNDSMAYDFGSSKVYFTNIDGETIELQDTFLVLLKKENGQWKMLREVASETVE